MAHDLKDGWPEHRHHHSEWAPAHGASRGRCDVVTQPRIISELLEIGLDDWVLLDHVVWLSTHGAIDPGTKRIVLEVLESLYSDGLMVPGDLGASGFEDWGPPSDGWVTRSEAELDRLDWRPMGAGFWLRLTTKGERVARRVAAGGDDEPG